MGEKNPLRKLRVECSDNRRDGNAWTMATRTTLAMWRRLPAIAAISTHRFIYMSTYRHVEIAHSRQDAAAGWRSPFRVVDRGMVGRPGYYGRRMADSEGELFVLPDGSLKGPTERRTAGHPIASSAGAAASSLLQVHRS
ncbi:hypothetical protein JK386_08515 [Nocardioides sp. zg-536]|uniref:Uncharacterized protein n=1 Tax=Nocardioides faecalis TaxID=2803858 RepID=A0A938Y668_9ACTN|nr:hypothetical protein [Nocardioides faecalis]MBM9459944.1 hypothetical protein [Nocardioides faecalis]QVI58831.1 hypothetical protein KG111_18080 [Nocardioides faecalis]